MCAHAPSPFLPRPAVTKNLAVRAAYALVDNAVTTKIHQALIDPTADSQRRHVLFVIEVAMMGETETVRTRAAKTLSHSRPAVRALAVCIMMVHAKCYP